MAQYEWVDVHSLKRWGDPSTEGSIGGSFGSGGSLGNNSDIKWGENIDFASNELFSYYGESSTGSYKANNSTIKPGSTICLNGYSRFTDRYYHYYHFSDGSVKKEEIESTSSVNVQFIMCEKFDTFKNLRLDNFKTVEFTKLSANYQHWSLYFVLEDGSMCRTKPYDNTVSNISIRIPIEKLTITDNRFLGKFLMYNARYTKFHNPGSSFTTLRDISDIYEWETVKIRHEATTTTSAYYQYKLDCKMIFQSIKFLK